MKTRVKSLGLLVTALFGLAAAPLQAQFSQVNAGALSTNQDSKLVFVNGANFDALSGFSLPLIYTLVTNFSITNFTFSSTNLQFWALSNQVPGGAAIGAYIVCEVLSVTGPSGGTLSFWEQGWRTPTYHFPVGVTPVVGSNRFDVSDIASGAGLVDGEPAGKIPLRRFTVNVPGDYFMVCKLFDTSTNTPTGAPHHTSSDPITLKFTTALDLAFTRVARNTNAEGALTLTFKQGALTNLYVEGSTNLALNDWTTLSGPFASAPPFNGTTTLSLTNPASMAAQFYRLRGVGP